MSTSNNTSSGEDTQYEATQLQKLNGPYFDFIKYYLESPSNVMWLHGSGNEGKTTLVNATSKALPNAMYTLSPDIFERVEDDLSLGKISDIIRKIRCILNKEPGIRFLLINETESSFDIHTLDQCARVFIDIGFIIVSNMETPKNMHWKSCKMEKYFDVLTPNVNTKSLSETIHNIIRL
uniref:Uncharacterized protein n=1 Tax=Pithovirus LCPAC101 TaxID=2506586 RepID=A0A481Z2Z8_9VIRU|nr:MAG: hypothetical protein LCPAC101_01580 [Pithovirus LCPAC101]